MDCRVDDFPLSFPCGESSIRSKLLAYIETAGVHMKKEKAAEILLEVLSYWLRDQQIQPAIEVLPIKNEPMEAQTLVIQQPLPVAPARPAMFIESTSCLPSDVHDQSYPTLTEFMPANDSITTSSESDDISHVNSLSGTDHPLGELGSIVKAEDAYSCSQCSYRTRHKPDFKRHETVHTGERPFQCPHCDYRATTSSNLSSHMYKHNSFKMLKCEFCSFRAHRKSQLKAHAHVHGITTESTVECRVCGYQAVNVHALTNHMRSHTKEKPFECPHCNYRGSYKCNLTSHILSKHSHLPQFACNMCDYRGSTPRSLKVHIRIAHRGERPHKCTECAYASANKSDLTRHIRTHTGERPYSCSNCDYRSTTKQNLDTHVVSCMQKTLIDSPSKV